MEAQADDTLLVVEDEEEAQEEEIDAEAAVQAEEGLPAATGGDEEALAGDEEQTVVEEAPPEAEAEQEQAEEEGEEAAADATEEAPAEADAQAEEGEVDVEVEEETVEVPVKKAPAKKKREPPLPPADLLQRIVFLNKQRWWPPGRLITVDALKALQTLPAACTERVLDRLEVLGGEVPNPSNHIHQAVKRLLANPESMVTLAAQPRKRSLMDASSPAAKRGRNGEVVEIDAPGAKGGDDGKGKGKGKFKGRGKAKGSLAAPITRAMVGDKIQELLDLGIALNVTAVTSLFRVTEQVAMAVLNEVRDRASVQDASHFVLDSVAKEEQRAKGTAPGEEASERPRMPNSELFKMRFALAVKDEEARKGKKGKGKGKGKDKGKEDGKGKAKAK